MSRSLDPIDGDAIIDCVATITIRDLEPQLKERLRVHAARHGRAMEEEARVILCTALAEREVTPVELGTAIHRRFGSLGSAKLAIPAREPMRAPPDLG